MKSKLLGRIFRQPGGAQTSIAESPEQPSVMESSAIPYDHTYRPSQIGDFVKHVTNSADGDLEQ